MEYVHCFTTRGFNISCIFVCTSCPVFDVFLSFSLAASLETTSRHHDSLLSFLSSTYKVPNAPVKSWNSSLLTSETCFFVLLIVLDEACLAVLSGWKKTFCAELGCVLWECQISNSNDYVWQESEQESIKCAQSWSNADWEEAHNWIILQKKQL